MNKIIHSVNLTKVYGEKETSVTALDNINVDREIVVNKSLNITLNRTIITSLTTLIVALVLYVFGGEILEPFAMALIIGVLTGTYSSLFIATPLMVILEDKYKLEDLEFEED